MSSTSAMGKSAKCSKNLWGSGSPKNTMSGFTMPVHTEQRGTLSTSTSACVTHTRWARGRHRKHSSKEKAETSEESFKHHTAEMVK